MKLKFEKPWIVTSTDEKFFYHSFRLADGEVIVGDWDLSEDFDSYIGKVDLCGKCVLDVGTATGYLAFTAEERGAIEVTALDMPSIFHEDRVPFKDFEYTQNKELWAKKSETGLDKQKKGFWYIWHRKCSQVRVSYCTIDSLLSVDDRFDVVIAGALLDHLGDPITALGAFCRLAKETVVLAFSPVGFKRGEYMKPLIPWEDSDLSYVWWVLSQDLYVRVFRNLGFEPQFYTSKAVQIGPDGERTSVERSTIVANRIH